MKISELIDRLQMLLVKHGDLPVYHIGDWVDREADKVAFVGKGIHGKGVWRSYDSVDRIVINAGSSDEVEKGS